MPQPTLPAAEYAAMAPLGAHVVGVNAKTVTSADTSMLMSLLASGEYIVTTLERTVGVTVYMKFGAAASVPNPTTGARVSAQMAFPADGEGTLVILPTDLTTGDLSLHMISTSSTVTVQFQQIS